MTELKCYILKPKKEINYCTLWLVYITKFALILCRESNHCIL